MEPEQQPLSEHEKEKIERLRRAMYSREMSEKLKEHPRRLMEDVRPMVGEDWHRPEKNLAASTVAPRSIVLARKALWWLLTIAAVFFVATIGFFGYYFTFGGGASSASPSNVDIAISGPPQIVGGDPTQLQIVVTNRNKVPLETAELVISYPPGTRSPADLSTDLSTHREPLGTIEAGGRRQGTVRAIFAASGGAASVKVDLEYRLRGSSAIFVATSNYQAALSSSPISLTIEGNSETISGQNVEMRVIVASNSNTTMKDVLVTATYPFGFKLKSAEPKARADVSGNLWEMGDLSPGQKREILIQGTLTGESGDERVFRFSAGTRKTRSEKIITTTLAESSLKLKVSDPFLGLTLSVNKSSGAKAVVSPGDNVNVALNWQNNLSTEIKDAVIVARLSGIQIDGATVLSQDGFFRSGDGVVLWDKNTTRGVLASLAAGSKGTVGFSFQVPDSEALKNIHDPYLTLTVNASGKRVSESGVPENLQATASQRVAISSDLRLTAQGHYYANPLGSVGPLPPKAGTETTYVVALTLTNTTNKIRNAKIMAVLPSYVRWTGTTLPRSEVVYIAGERQESGKITTPPPGDPCQGNKDICWSIGTIEPGIGLSGAEPRQAVIAIGFTPSTSQIGQEPPLFQEITLTGIDDATGAPISRTVKDVTTNIIGDPGFSATGATVVR